VSLYRTSSVSEVPTLQNMLRTVAERAHSASVYSRPGSDGSTTMVIEVTDVHRNLLARSVIDAPADASRETVADHLLVDSYLDRYSAFRIDPVHKHRRLVALVGLRLSLDPTPYEQERQRGTALSA